MWRNESQREELRDGLCADSEDTLLLYVGSLEKIKRPQAAVRIVATLPDQYKLAVIGDGEQCAAAERVAREESIANRVQFVGERSHVRTLQSMLVADGLLLTSESESYSAVVLEALACSCEMFATSVGVVPEIEGQFDRLEVCTIDEMADRIRKRDDFASAVEVDETVIERFPIKRYTDTICDSFLAVSGGDLTSSVEHEIAGR